VGFFYEKRNERMKGGDYMTMQRSNSIDKNEKMDPVEAALDIIMHETSPEEALEYSADQTELTRTIGELAVTFDMLFNDIPLDKAMQKYSAYGIDVAAFSRKFTQLEKAILEHKYLAVHAKKSA
jgi:hypothetical protein